MDILAKTKEINVGNWAKEMGDCMLWNFLPWCDMNFESGTYMCAYNQWVYKMYNTSRALKIKVGSYNVGRARMPLEKSFYVMWLWSLLPWGVLAMKVNPTRKTIMAFMPHHSIVFTNNKKNNPSF